MDAESPSQCAAATSDPDGVEDLCDRNQKQEKLVCVKPSCAGSSDLQESRHDVRQQLHQGLLGDAFNDFGLHLNGSQVDGVVGCLHDGAQHLDALLRVDGTSQRGRSLLGRPYHLRAEQRRWKPRLLPVCSMILTSISFHRNQKLSHLLMRIFMSLQRLHDGQLRIVFKPGRLVL